MCLVGAPACDGAPVGVPPSLTAGPLVPVPAVAPLEARPARRCGECHESYLTEWSGSAHAGSARAPAYQAMRAQAPGAAACDRCHAPLTAVLDPKEAVVAEGVTCEVCHAISEVTLAPEAASWTLQLAENRKYGPLCDVEEPYFHRAGCSPLHADSRLCAACHHLTHTAAGVALPVFSEFEEWQHGDGMRVGLHCQGCHMPERAPAVASGGPVREGASPPGDGPAGGDALALDVRVRADADGLQVSGHVHVSGAPHALPVGLPGRELALVAELVDGTGVTIASDVAVYSRVLVDASGAEVPFFRALRVGADTRLQPGERRPFVLRLPTAPPGAHVELELLDRPLSAALARTLAIAAPEPKLLQTRRILPPWDRTP